MSASLKPNEEELQMGNKIAAGGLHLEPFYFRTEN